MKKIIYLLFLLLLLFPIIAKADMDSPAIKEYDAVVKDLSGAKYYDYKMNIIGTLNYDTKITIYSEDIWKNEYYGWFIFPDTNDYYMIKLSKISPLSSSYDPTENEKIHVNLTGLVVINGVYLYSGPSHSYKKVTKEITSNTKLTLTYSCEVSGVTPWYYTEYEGIKGWINTLNGAFVFEEEEKEFVIPLETSIYSLPTSIYDLKSYSRIPNDTDENKELGLIPKNTKIKIKYYTDNTYLWSNNVYVTYEGISGFISRNSLAITVNDETVVALVDNITMYESPDKKSKVILDSIPKNIPYEYTLTYSNYDNEIGWYYIKINNKTGWIYGDSTNGELDIDYKSSSEESISSTINDLESSRESVGSTIMFKNISTKSIIIYCVSGALLATITATVIITLVNKKKNISNNEEKKKVRN